MDRRRNNGMLRQCPLGIAQQLPYHAIAVATAMRIRVTKTMSVSPQLGKMYTKLPSHNEDTEVFSDYVMAAVGNGKEKDEEWARGFPPQVKEDTEVFSKQNGDYEPAKSTGADNADHVSPT